MRENRMYGLTRGQGRQFYLPRSTLLLLCVKIERPQLILAVQLRTKAAVPVRAGLPRCVFAVGNSRGRF